MRRDNGTTPRAGWWVLLLLQMLAGATVWGSGPRWVAGQGYFSPIAQPVTWYTDHVRYFTDAGDLSASVSHSARRTRW